MLYFVFWSLFLEDFPAHMICIETGRIHKQKIWNELSSPSSVLVYSKIPIFRTSKEDKHGLKNYGSTDGEEPTFGPILRKVQRLGIPLNFYLVSAWKND